MIVMTQTFAALQTPPHERRRQEVNSRRALEAAAAHLVRTAQHLSGAEPSYAEALRDSLQALRQAYTALLEWHSLPPRPDARLAELARPAERLDSMIRTCWDRAGTLEALEAALGSGAALTGTVREQIATSYFTARNTLAVVLGALPERITPDAIWSLNRAEAIRAGRTEAPREEPESRRTPLSVLGRPARRRPAAAA